MGFFSKNKNENNGFIINSDDDSIKISGNKNLAPHAMTVDEVSSLWVLNSERSNDNASTGALDSLKKRMNVTIPQAPKAEKIDLTKSEQSAAELKNDEEPTVEKAIVESAEEKTIEHIHETLIEKVKRYTIDEHGRDVSENKEPLYHLQSVADIIMSDGENAMKDLSKKYGLEFISDDLDKAKKPTDSSKHKENKEKQNPIKITNPKTVPTPAFEQMVTDSAVREKDQILSYIENNKKEDKTPNISVPDISDIDNHEIGVAETDQTANTATIRFTPIKNAKGNTDHIAISSITRHIDLNDDNLEDVTSNKPVHNLEQTEFDKFLPEKEVSDTISGKKILRRCAIKIRSGFISVLFSILSLIALSVFLIPPIFDHIIGNPKNAMFICGSFLLISILANISMFADFKNLIKKRCGFDVLASLCSILTLSLAIVAALTQQNAYYTILLCAIILLARSICRFKEISTFTNNLKRIINDNSKKAVSLINDPATTFVMSKNSIDGDVLIAAQRNTNFINDFIKHSTFTPKLSGKTSLIFYLSVAFSFICFLMTYFYYQGLYEAFYSAATISSIVAMPSIFFISCLPLASAAKKLNPRGAMIAGMYGAEKIELTNAAVIGINDIFPSGTIKMYSMKVLSNNNIDDTILKAASLTAAVNSPLENIFKQIAGTNSSYSMPDSDTVKYEKNLGISGWVNNELLFIGNRSLMQAHGIQIPSLEIDKKILRKGYFPVYVATVDTACALIVIQYEAKAEIAKDLRKVTDLGLTLLVENYDPNITEEMICDYFDLYEGSVKIMSNSGVYMYKNACVELQECSAPASYRGSNLNLIKIVNCASMIMKSNKLLTVLYSIFAISGVMYFIYAAFSGATTIPAPLTMLLYETTACLLSIIGFLIRKP